jgi:hypothetical protein
MNFVNQDLLLDAIQLNPESEIEVSYHSLTDKEGYWIVRNLFYNFPLFVEFAKLSPVFPSNDSYGLNCFFKQNLPYVQLRNLKWFVQKFEKEHLNPDDSAEGLVFDNYGNIFQQNKILASTPSLFPHSDSPLAPGLKPVIVSNLWLSEGDNGGTAFWKFKGNPYGNEDYIRYVNSLQNEVKPFENFEGDEFIEKLGESPAEYGTMTIYNPALLHSPVVNKNPDHLRWSQVLVGMKMPS